MSHPQTIAENQAKIDKLTTMFFAHARGVERSNDPTEQTCTHCLAASWRPAPQGELATNYMCETGYAIWMQRKAVIDTTQETKGDQP